ncbi:hypothetical protein LEMLEM_LOCUS3813 [Lemmus lemmus]
MTWRQKPASQRRKEIPCLWTSLSMFITWWKIMGKTIRLWPGMRRITIKIPQNRFGIRSMSISVFTQQSGNLSLILCRIRRWRLTEWCTSPDRQVLSQGVYFQMMLAKCYSISFYTYTHTHSLSFMRRNCFFFFFLLLFFFFLKGGVSL